MSRRVRTEARIGVGDGVSSFFGGVGFVLGTPGVWGYALVPAAMLLVLFCGLGGLGFWGSGKLSEALIPYTGRAALAGQWAITVVAWLASLAVAFFVALALAQPLSGWALEAICRAQERALTGRCSPEPSFLRSVWLSARVSVVTAVVGAAVTGSLAVVTFFFPPAGVVTVPLKFLVVAWLVAWNLVDYPLGLRGLGLRRRLAWSARHFGALTAFGLVWAVVLLVPGVALLVLPMGVAGATRLVVAADGPPVLDALPA